MDNDPVCRSCRGPSALADEECISCLGTGPRDPKNVCPLAFVENVGIVVTVNGDFRIFTAPNGIIINVERLNNALDQVNSQLPTGSLQGYLSQIFNNVGSNLSTNAKYILSVLLGGSIALSFVFFSMICIILMSYSIISVGVGLVLILIGILFSILVFIIVLSEASKFGTDIENGFVNEIEPVVDTLRCAALSGICCYSGISCCCPGVSPSACKNPPPPPP